MRHNESYRQWKRGRTNSGSVWTVVVLAVLLGLALATGAAADKPIDETRRVAPHAAIDIEMIAGSVKVTGWDQDEVHIGGSMGDDVERLEIKGGARGLSIEPKLPDGGFEGNRDLTVDLEIRVPYGVNLDVETVSAGIEVVDVNGQLDLESVSGSVTVSGEPSEVDAETVSGAIHIVAVSAPVDAESVSGRIHVEGASGELDVSTVSGKIEVSGGTIRDGQVEAVSGPVRLEVDLGAGASLEVDAHSSNVLLVLPADVSARFEVSTFSGGIDNAFGPPAERNEHGPGKSLNFSTGGGGAEVAVSTFSGNVELRKQ